MTRIDIISGFLGAGKTTLIKKLIGEAYKGEKVVLIENEFGEIGIDGGFLAEAGIEITEMNSGCICCSLVGDFGEALNKVITDLAPDRIVIEPSGVGKLSDVISAVKNAAPAGAVLGGYACVVDAKKCKMYMKNFGEFFNNQIESANAIILSHTSGLSEEKLADCIALLREHNQSAAIVSTDWSVLPASVIIEAMESASTLSKELDELEHEQRHHHHHHDDDEECECHHHNHDDDEECECHHHHHHDDEECECHHHHHHDDDEECECHHHHHDDDDEECECHHHHHHDDDEECECHHHHHHDDDEECECHHHHHGHHHHHHHADEVFTSFGRETVKKYTKDEITEILTSFESEEFGIILRAKGMVEAKDGGWIFFDYVPGEPDVREGVPSIIGKICVIGSGINEDKIKDAFGL